MIPFPAVYDWFLKRASPLFSLYTQALIHDLDQATNARDRLLIIYELENYAETQALISEKGEILTFCAVFYFQNHLKDSAHYAVKLLNRALVEFEKKSDDLNQALVYSLLYYPNLLKKDWIEIFIDAHQALRHFLKCAERLCSEEDRKQGCIYLDRAKDIAFELVSFPDFTYQLLNEFDASQLSLSSHQIIDEIDAALRQNDTVAVKRGLELLTGTARRSSYPQEVAEAYIYGAQIMDWLGDIPQSIKLLKRAVAWFSPESHNQLFARWMLALFQLQVARDYQQAVIHFEAVVSGIDALITTCDRQNQLDQRLWYEAFASGMRRVMEKVVNLKRLRELESDPFIHTRPRRSIPRPPSGSA